MQYTQGADKS
ncbi:Protein of unknown function [Bacillus cereus]|nr:Protein of unknown function [Bacillus cereus]